MKAESIKLSVVVPTHNVHNYVEEALESLRTQSHSNLEIIMIDDGSTDDTRDILRSYADMDHRFKLIEQEQSGQSAARNRGIRNATGEYITFMDGDDVVEPDAYKVMIAAAAKNDADVVTGNVRRLMAGRLRQSWHHKDSHRETREITDLREAPELLYDTVVWNKVYKRSFWERRGFRFPEGVIFEDMYLALRAYAEARRICIVADYVYQWRVRDEQTSDTQQLSRPKNVLDRITALRQIHRSLLSGADRTLLEVFYTKLVNGDLWFNARGLSEGSQEFVLAYEAMVKEFWPSITRAVRQRTPIENRIVYNAIVRGRVDTVPGILSWFDDHPYELPVVVRGSKAKLTRKNAPKFVLDIPRSDLDVSKNIPFRATITDLRWTPDRQLKISGWAYLEYFSDSEQDLKAYLVNTAGTRIPLRIERTEELTAQVMAGDPNRSHATSGFSAFVPFDETVDVQMYRNGTWELELELSIGRYKSTSRPTRIWRSGGATVLGSRTLSDGRVVVPLINSGRPLRLHFRRPKFVLESIKIEGRTVSGRVVATTVENVESIVLHGRSKSRLSNPAVQGPSTQQHDAGTFSFELPKAGEHGGPVWRVMAYSSGKRSNVAWLESTKVDVLKAERGLAPLATPRGWSIIRRRWSTFIVRELNVTSDSIVMNGDWTGRSKFVELGFSRDEQPVREWHALKVDLSTGRAEVEISLRTADWYGRSRPWPSGRYTPVLRFGELGPKSGTPSLFVTNELSGNLPHRYQGDDMRAQVDRVWGGSFVLRVRPAVQDAELGAFGTGLSRRLVSPPLTVEREASVFFRMDMGASAGDSGLAIQLELQRRNAELNYYWGVKDHSIPVAPGGISLLDNSRMWQDKIARAEFVVNNYGAIMNYVDQPHQTYIQTWHGTPLKIIGLSEWKHLSGSQKWLEEKRESAAAWDYLVTSSPFTTDLFPREFLYDGPVLELGMARNDRVALAGVDQRNHVLTRLGIDPGKRTLLYAPTYRDSLRSNWRADAFRGLDLQALSVALGDEWVILSRGHSFNKRAGAIMGEGGNVVDATFHPDIADLYIAADACVTDYSSVMFDYSVTRKPLFFFVPDYDDYLSTRPTYMDLNDIAPSPLLFDFDALVQAVREVDSYKKKYGLAYERFRTTFAPHDDGFAAKRIVDEIFVPKMKALGLHIDE